MAQLSRPYQIGLAAIVLLAAVWLVLLQGHSSSPSSPASSATVAPASTTPSATASTKASTKSSSKAGTHASAPGVAGLTRAIEKAHGAAAVSQQNNRHLQEKSAQASTPSSTSSATSSPAAATKAAAPTTSTPSATTTAPSSTTTKSTPNVASRLNSPTRQRDVEAQLAKGKVALILFWNPKGADDQEIHNALGKLSAKDIAVNQAPAGDIASFGTITRGIQVYGTPTLLIVNKKGEAITLTGPQDAFVIDQAISEARHP